MPRNSRGCSGSERLAALALLTALAPAAAVAQLPDPVPAQAAAYLVMVQGRPLWGRAVDTPRQPASLAKLMTALLVIEQGQLDRIVTVGEAAARETGSRLGLRKGDRMAVRELLAATVIASANDACRALAEHVAGSSDKFVERMNQRTRELGLASTRFADPCGHDRAGQHSTARDLAQLALAALDQPVFAELAATVEADLRTADGGRRFRVANTNELLGRYPGLTGVKSGYTPGAGKCVVALAERDGVQVVLVLLDAPDRWWSAESILDQAFARP